MRTVVFFVKSANTVEGFRDAFNVAVFLHEMGHVDDFERGRNLVVGQPVDARKAELYAHDYACRTMIAVVR